MWLNVICLIVFWKFLNGLQSFATKGVIFFMKTTFLLLLECSETINLLTINNKIWRKMSQHLCPENPIRFDWKAVSLSKEWHLYEWWAISTDNLNLEFLFKKLSEWIRKRLKNFEYIIFCRVYFFEYSTFFLKVRI